MVQFGHFSTNPQRGETVEYQGKQCKVLSVEKWGTVIADANGNKIYVDLKNPIFESCKSYCQEQIDYYNKEYEECSKKAQEALEEAEKQKAKAEKMRQKNLAIMARYKKISDPKQLQGHHRIDYENNQRQFKKFMNLASDANSVFEINNSSALDAAFSGGKWANQMILTNAIGNSFGL